MDLKKLDLRSLLKGGKKKKSGPGRPIVETVTASDLIIEGRLEEAEELLKERLKKNVRDYNAQLKLADLHLRMKRPSEAVEGYLMVADGYAREGFMDKAIATLTKVQRLTPENSTVALKLQAFREAKRMERSRDEVASELTGEGATRTSSFRLKQVWRHLAGSALLSALEQDQLKRLFSQIEYVDFEPKQIVAKRGETREELFIIAEGSIEAGIVKDDGGFTGLRAFGSGDIIGDRALFEHQPWPATYRTAAKTQVLRLDKNGLEAALVGNPDPRALLVALRAARHDREIVEALSKLET